MSSDGYLPIRDHGAIGNLRSVALVGLDATIDWLCLPDLESPSVFGALLDHRRGGRFAVRAGAGTPRCAQRYLPETNVLETTIHQASGRIVLTDFMPLEGRLEGRQAGSPSPELHRLIRCEGEAIEVEVEWSPRLNFGRALTWIRKEGPALVATDAAARVLLRGLPEARIEQDGWGPVAVARFRMEPGDERALVTGWADAPCDPGSTSQKLAATIRAWRTWLHAGDARCRIEWAAPWVEQVQRSELALKLLCHAETGAIAAAATTSLPAELGGVRNWDYRYAWLRDTSFTAQAFTASGHPDDARAFLEFVENLAEQCGDGRCTLRIMYDLHGGEAPGEEELHYLEGYRGSRPVRVGNLAAEQRQLDIYGELLDAGYDLVRAGFDLPAELRSFLAAVADRACHDWQLRGSGIWEMRGKPRHFVHSKVMCWVALDRAVQLAELGILRGDVDGWRRNRTAIREEVCRRGYSEKRRAFVQSYEEDALDAANLVLPLLEFLPIDDERVQNTIEAVRRELLHDGLVARYLGDDALPGADQGAFCLVSFWLVDCLALSGRLEEAEELMQGIVARQNHLGLYAELIEPGTGRFLGNFPQAFTHVGLINSALYLARAKGRPLPLAPIGTLEHRRTKGHDPATEQ